MWFSVTRRVRHAAGHHPLAADTVFGLMLALPALAAVVRHGDRPLLPAAGAAVLGKVRPQVHSGAELPRSR
ncbi:hypothetical protein ACWT_3170 [Actinoplanes sp. SE50]|uniref:hypothetical protein n=1 Tax=unclassified Actinoplanes TaxID=2626549 RepID=UPI00023EC610|nr:MULTISPECIES: hypothetical protein [unclassified Actinoplanes]AEV84193.1 hypothetical protein ACPL_3298 [Actinoplanes sp. SE50/110]ATO82585.1 hypothetical protein ACWT_3170 [Actinoplanes sp. SE50]SLL99992.1 hypothetical protein ACSP50_3224 [Actinoplanes sp. SE50/110]